MPDTSPPTRASRIRVSATRKHLYGGQSASFIHPANFTTWTAKTNLPAFRCKIPHSRVDFHANSVSDQHLDHEQAGGLFSGQVQHLQAASIAFSCQGLMMYRYSTRRPPLEASKTTLARLMLTVSAGPGAASGDARQGAPASMSAQAHRHRHDRPSPTSIALLWRTTNLTGNKHSKITRGGPTKQYQKSMQTRITSSRRGGCTTFPAKLPMQ